MAILDGVGIVSAGKEAQAKALTRAKQAQSNKKIAAEYLKLILMTNYLEI